MTNKSSETQLEYTVASQNLTKSNHIIHIRHVSNFLFWLKKDIQSRFDLIVLQHIINSWTINIILELWIQIYKIYRIYKCCFFLSEDTLVRWRERASLLLFLLPQQTWGTEVGPGCRVKDFRCHCHYNPNLRLFNKISYLRLKILLVP